MTVITIEQLADGMMKCEKEHPTVGVVLSSEMNRLCNVAGTMNAQGINSIDTEDFERIGLSKSCLDEVKKWCQCRSGE